MPQGPDFRTALTGIRARIAAACTHAARDPATVKLIAVSKFHPRESVLEAIAAGQTIFGENRVQEAAQKFVGLHAENPKIKLHLIGGLQTNKARLACRIADVIESLDRPALADAIARAADQDGRLPSMFVQVNTGDEPQKYGIPRTQADEFIRQCQRRFGPACVGVMGIPPQGCDPAPHFAYLATLAATHGLSDISMGMSADFETAIAHGATHIRVGTALFGHRPQSINPPVTSNDHAT